MIPEKGTICREKKAASQWACPLLPASGRPGLPGAVPGARCGCELDRWSLSLMTLPRL